ncbi:MAG: aminodeoxychorismate synthase component I [Chloroflexi bacterium]|nr:aminodeoxychorismate synthase component I [Chloroflexota bacterium]
MPFTVQPEQVAHGLARRPLAFYLDSAMGKERLGRFSFFGLDPFLSVRAQGRRSEVLGRHGYRIVHGDPFDLLRGLLVQYQVPPGDFPMPLVGGAVGYLGYGLRHCIEKLPSRAHEDLHLPDLYLGFYDVHVALDHLLGKMYVVSTGLPEGSSAGRRQRAYTRAREMRRWLERLAQASPAVEQMFPAVAARMESNMTREAYVGMVQQARRYIEEGEVYQVNLSQRFRAPLAAPSHQLYARLRQLNPAPFAAYLRFPGLAIASSSPERFLRLRGSTAETRPIKGTIRRGKTQTADAALAAALRDSHKDRAEHIMIVDLERNDLGRVCETGSVQVSEFMALERYATVHHLTSTVEGVLRTDKDRIDLLRACFPGGSITGAPKVRAMEIIDELEPTARGIYTGAIGYFSFDGGLDINIVIRTIVATGGYAYFHVGGGIVYDSDPEKEYQESLDKGEALMDALGGNVPSVVPGR